MAESGNSGMDETARLEAALARIARARSPGRLPSSQMAPSFAGPDARDLATRLDALIAELRSVLGRDSAD